MFISGLCVLLWVVEVVTWLPVGEFLRLDPGVMRLSQCTLKSLVWLERGFYKGCCDEGMDDDGVWSLIGTQRRIF